MLKQFAVIAAVALVFGCASDLPRYRVEALTRSYAVKGRGAEGLFPQEYASLVEALTRGDRLMLKGEGEEADRYYLLALGKSDLITQMMDEERKRQDAIRQEAEEKQRETERQQALQELKRKLEVERDIREREARKIPEKSAVAREKEPRQLAQYHTVKRGETLPQIAAQSDVYGDVSLWPLLYRANRDQIRDPRRIWPGQVLRIPRNLTREDLAEARRYAQERILP
ncbi:LysM peptidoglycan-binding domain-containing protein [Geobacter pickeringii]|uniref:Potassium binding protein Kbp n=1 Tax=Geobacter pickeringii TaxID=345632 RepID=A0A0B5BFY1_9BACT|nr:LysM peptidoglycan-binding domain-containing protein [Geobacter pickeringii]AJE03430.1 peptidoglycan-binding protein LysM [Geobacter pickeringii]